ncbi:hypothetical protein CFC21_029698 [Triticum aestivum]|uniref:Small EDRK-rich factor-like N-terminal domain-containing protein n=2 Tax=Triticum aestivum TaxID=4565 RepID=A0A9R1JGC1_WHEAT|nr:hypothetical protein CFC21_029698 [Triticum aestivum]
MGGGNAQKSKMARERNLEKLKGGKGSQLEANKKAMNIQCIISLDKTILAVMLPTSSSNFLSANGCAPYWIAEMCKICMQTFICTTSEAKCKEHAEAKHPKSDLVQCFPHLKQ